MSSNFPRPHRLSVFAQGLGFLLMTFRWLPVLRFGGPKL